MRSSMAQSPSSPQHVIDVRDLLATGKVWSEGVRLDEIDITRAHNNRVLSGWSVGLDCAVEGKRRAASISMNTALNCHGAAEWPRPPAWIGLGLGTGISPAERDNLICSDAPVHLLSEWPPSLKYMNPT